MKPVHVPRIEHEPDNPNVVKSVVIACGTLAVFGVGLGYVIVVLQVTQTPARTLGGAVPKETGRDEIGMVEQRMFEGDTRLKIESQAQRNELENYGWIDRDAGIVHIPIARAMAEIVQDGGTP